MTATVNMHEAKTHFSKLVERALAGEDIVVAKAGKPCIRLVPVVPEPLPPRRPGRFKDLLRNVSVDDVLAPCLTDEELDVIESADVLPRPA